MGGATAVSDSDLSDDDLLARSIFDGFEIRIHITPQKRRANDKKPTKAKKRRSGAKTKREPQWKCNKCDLVYSNKANLVRHEKKAHSKSPKNNASNLNECRLCDTNYSILYKHYGEHHSIDYVEDLLFDDGTTLVNRSPDTEKGKAAWFINQMQKAKRRLNALKCRLCEFETEFVSKEQLKHHYTTDHKVEDNYLENVEHLYRMEKSAHLKSDGDRKRKSVPKNQTDKTTNDDHCELCGEKHNCLYKHYGTVHGIDNVEEIVFKNGNALIRSSVDTEKGEAAWFLNEKKIAEERLNDRKCRLCVGETEFGDVEVLEHHYTKLSSNGGHHVHPEHLSKLEYLFRKDKKAHLKETSDSSNRSKGASRARAADDKVNKPKKKVDDNVKSKTKGQPENIQEMSIIMYICNCGVATETYDASVDHAQTHLVRNYATTTKRCPRCDYTFEEARFKDHVSRHGNEDDNTPLKTINYDHTTLMSDKWFDMFSALPDTSYAEKIVALSIYKHTRSVKMSWKVGESGVPLYQCDTCKLFVDPAKVENHIGACNTSEHQGYNCPECDISFSTANALKKHGEDHTTRGFRYVTFNNKKEMQFNKALIQHQRPSEESFQESNEDEEIIENPKRLETNEGENIFDNGVMKFCYQCKRSVNNFDVHSAAHKTETKKRMDAILRKENVSNSDEDAVKKQTKQDKQISQSDHCGMNTYVNENDVQKTSTGEVTKDDSNRMEIDLEDTVTPWENDDASESIQDSFIVVTTQAQIHLGTKDYDRNNIERVSHFTGQVKPGEENDEDISEAVDELNDVQGKIGPDDSNGLVIDKTFQANIQAEAEPAENDNDVNEIQQKENVTLNISNQENTYSAEDDITGESNQDKNEMNLSSAELYLRQVGGANENDTGELDKDVELQSTQELIQIFEETENNKDSTIQEDRVQSPRICTNNEVTQEPVTKDITHLLPLIRQLTNLSRSISTLGGKKAINVNII